MPVDKCLLSSQLDQLPSRSAALFTIQLNIMTNNYVIPEECRAAVVVDEGPNFTIKTQTVKVPVPGDTIQIIMVLG